jgi:hypothetical protein
MLKHLIIQLLLALNFGLHAQVPHEKPEHPKGNIATQLEALPFYNEACELYANGKIDRAKRSLYESINTSFALTESHLFLADILYEQGIIDSAFFFYNSGIDFVIEQKPHYYFYLFETGIKSGQYDLVKHNLKHFKKLYGSKTDIKPYEEEYPFHYGHYEIYKAQIDELFAPNLWIPKAELVTSFKSEDVVRTINPRKLYSIENGRVNKVVSKRRTQKSKKVKGLKGDLSAAFVTDDGEFILFSTEVDTHSQIYYCKKKGRKYSEPIKLPSEINISHWVSDPFLTSDKSQLYFSALVNGNKDLFVVNLNLDDNTAEIALPLTRINTERDETSPFFDEEKKVFYFSSDQQKGFGGFDIYFCNDYEIIIGQVFPFNSQNMGSPINSSKSEISFGLHGPNYLVSRKEQGIILKEYKPILIESIDYDIRFFKISNNVD